MTRNYTEPTSIDVNDLVDPVELNDHQARIVQLVACGLTNEEIAADVFLSPRTVAHQLSELLQLSCARNRAELVARGFASGCLVPHTWPPALSGRRAICANEQW